ncbi:MAG TPA: DSD1 family PLP-dependent enzyme [Phycisphaerae bacterium]|nr:DSD1 family PLP-dependent enzyme [Phycisphaerae bacterium]HSA27414.1 DSD1 family PLP-dependent enzyme [Phycisphaerae bacterium]
MSSAPRTGTAIQDLDTPALLVDGPAMMGNIERMAAFFRGRPAQLRPHFKNHKCTQIARRQLAAGSAVGMTVAKLAEAEVLAGAGIDDVLIANQVVGDRKLERLAYLARRIHLRLAVDHIDQAVALSRAVSAAGATVGVLIEIDIGMGRCGLPPGEPVVALAGRLADLPGVRFDGLQAYEGHLVSVADPEDRRVRVIEAFREALDTRALLERSGLPVRVISGGSTSTYAITGVIEGVDEIQAGTYATMDCVYQRLMPEFGLALSVIARVISRPRPGVAVLDVGVKGVGHEFGPPQVKGCPGARVPSFMSEEHCIIHDAPGWRVGDAVELVPSHACTTCNLYRQIHVHDGGRIVDLWPIEGSGGLT